jgi:uncharacterized protein YjbJ (UPF0337 family)
VTIADRTWDNLPPEIHSRIMAATAHADVRLIRQSDTPAPDAPDGVWEVNSLAGDRFVHMVLGLRPDGSVSEETRTFLLPEILEISFDTDGATVEVDGPSGPESVRIPEPIGRELNLRRQGGFEGTVKGIGQGIAGRLKELAGELLDLADLEDEGIAQQLEGKARRAQSESATRAP